MSTQTNLSKSAATNLPDLSGHKRVVGAKQIRKAFNNGAVSKVFLAENADPAITEPLVALCQHHRVDVSWVRSMTDLGHAFGIEVGAAAAAIVA